MEIWKDIEGFDGRYKISNLSRVKRIRVEVNYRHGRRFLKEKILKSTINKRTGYYQIILSRKSIQIHREVAKNFVEGYSPELVVNHKNGIKTDNRPVNLEWCSLKDNNIHARSIGLVNDYGENSSNSKLKNWQIFYIKYVWNGKGIVKLAKLYGINYKTIYKIKNGSRWAHI